MTLKTLKTCLIALVATCTLGAAQLKAATVTLDSLLNGGSIVSGDKFFDNFSYQFTGQTPGAADVTVTPFDIAGDFGIKFTGGFVDAPGNNASSATISFDVTVLDPMMEIVGVTLNGNPSLFVFGNAATVTETINNQYKLDIFELSSPADALQLTDSVMFEGMSKLSITKDIKLDGGSGYAGLSVIEQTFKQAPVPEPASLGLCGLGALGLLAARRRK